MHNFSLVLAMSATVGQGGQSGRAVSRRSGARDRPDRPSARRPEAPIDPKHRASVRRVHAVHAWSWCVRRLHAVTVHRDAWSWCRVGPGGGRRPCFE